ncbi:MAG: hypothetical protein DLM55_02530 [Acidimicrobiales bacterium]|nr:MAG: hypothetical protein DLM55_02530 [Acidimicrobiales bacterium]
MKNMMPEEPKALAEQERVGPALAWIVGALERHGTPYQVIGGLAARAWGGSREVVDIDLYVPLDQARQLLIDIEKHIVWGPQYYYSKSWDLTFAKVDFGTQRIELADSASNPRFFNILEDRWEDQAINYCSSLRRGIFGVECNVMPKDELIQYKRALDRPVDRIDVAELTST